MASRIRPPRSGRGGARAAPLLAVALAALIGMAGCGLAPTPEPLPTTVDVPVVAADGGVVEHPAGFALTVPPGALSRDATVRVTDLGYPDPVPDDAFGAIDPFDPLLVLSRSFAVDLGGAEALADLRLELAVASPLGPGLAHAGFFPDNLMLRGRDAAGVAWLRPVRSDDDGGTIVATVREAFAFPDLATFAAVYSPVEILPIQLPILDVPYYWQDARPWCGPTSLAMVVNTHARSVTEIVSNWGLAGDLGQDQDAGAWPHDLLDAAGAPADSYHHYHWDADLIPNGPFTAYVQRYTRGYNLRDLFGPVLDLGFVRIAIPDVDVPPRPVNLSSSTTNHAFVAVGSSDVGIWLHDSSGAFAGSAGIALFVTWPQFRATAIDTVRSDELYTLVLDGALRPEAERRGSIVLFENGPAAGDTDGSLSFSDGSRPISRWQWDGDPYGKGGYWDDPYGLLPDDPIYGNALLVGAGMAGRIGYRVNVANVGSEARDFRLHVVLVDADETLLDARSHTLTVAARSWAGNASGDLDPSGAADGAHTLRFSLYQDGVLQDVKVVEFGALRAGID